MPDPLAGERHAAQGEEEARGIVARAFARADAGQMRPAFAQIVFERLMAGAAKRDDALLVAFAAHLDAARIEARGRWWRAR